MGWISGEGRHVNRVQLSHEQQCTYEIEIYIMTQCHNPHIKNERRARLPYKCGAIYNLPDHKSVTVSVRRTT